MATTKVFGILADRGVDLEMGVYWARVGERYFSGHDAAKRDAWFEDAIEAATFTPSPEAVAIRNRLMSFQGVDDETRARAAGRRPWNNKESK